MEHLMAGIHEVYPYLRVHNAAEAISFYGRAFGAEDAVAGFAIRSVMNG
jgi:hypothetical protein